MMRYLKLMIIGILLCACSCAQFGTYLENRALDLVDPFMLRVGADTGAHVSVQVFRVGPAVIIGYTEMIEKYGYVGREYVYSNEGLVGLLIFGGRLYGGGEGGKDYFASFHHVICNNVAAEIFFFSDALYEILGIGNFDSIPDNITTGQLKHLFWIEADVCIFADLNIGINPYEFVDFLFGFFTIDISGDDKPLAAEQEKPVKSE